MIASMRRFSQSEVAQERLRIIKYYQRYGERATREAFGLSRQTIFVWSQKLQASQGRATSLIPLSTKPHQVRVMATDPQIYAYIKDLRVKYPTLGKGKIYPLLVAYCQQNHLVPIKESTIGKVIKRNHLFYAKQGRIYHDPSTQPRWRKLSAKRTRVKYAPRYTQMGHLQMDTLVTFATGVRQYVYSAIDTYFKFSLSLPYPKLSCQVPLLLHTLSKRFWPRICP
jgi:transposase-like protein